MQPLKLSFGGKMQLSRSWAAQCAQISAQQHQPHLWAMCPSEGADQPGDRALGGGVQAEEHQRVGKETDWWTCSLPSLVQQQNPTMAPDTKDFLPSRHQAVRDNPEDGRERKGVTAQGSRGPHPQPALPCQVPVYNRYEALESDGQAADAAGEDPSGKERSSRQPMPHMKPSKSIKISHVKRKRRVIVIGDLLLEGTEGLISRPDPQGSLLPPWDQYKRCGSTTPQAGLFPFSFLLDGRKIKKEQLKVAVVETIRNRHIKASSNQNQDLALAPVPF
nr:uncharacterized protein LOC110359033 [Columba livia]